MTHLYDGMTHLCSSFRKELKGNASIVRELHVYGSAVPVGGRHPKKFQHHVCNITTLYIHTTYILDYMYTIRVTVHY